MHEYIDKEKLLKDISNAYDNLEFDFAKRELIGSFKTKIKNATAKDVMFVNQWISIKNELPKDEGRVLTVNEYGRIHINFLKDVQKGMWRYNIGGKITHWQPLPKPPTGKE